MMRVELLMAADAFDSDQSFSTAAIERFHKDQLCEDFQKLTVLDDLFDCTFVATKDKR